MFPTQGPRNGTPKPTFWLQEGSLGGPTEGLGQPIREAPPLKLGVLLRRLRPFKRDDAWETHLPEAYRPLAEYDAAVNAEWGEDSPEDIRNENLQNEKSHLNLLLTPRSQRTQYGLDLTRALMGEIKTLTEQRGGRFLVFGINTLPHTLGLLGDSPDEVYKIGGKFYRISVRQYRENLEYLNGGFDYHWIPLTLEPSRVGPEDVHLNEHAVEQVMRDVASVVGPYLLARPASASMTPPKLGAGSPRPCP